jgi:hypothetical protein
MNLDRKTIAKVWQTINKLKRVGYKVTDKTVVMRVNVMKDGEVEKVQDVTYKNIKKYLRKI